MEELKPQVTQSESLEPQKPTTYKSGFLSTFFAFLAVLFFLIFILGIFSGGMVFSGAPGPNSMRDFLTLAGILALSLSSLYISRRLHPNILITLNTPEKTQKLASSGNWGTTLLIGFAIIPTIFVLIGFYQWFVGLFK